MAAPALERMRQKDLELKASLGYTENKTNERYCRVKRVNSPRVHIAATQVFGFEICI